MDRNVVGHLFREETVEAVEGVDEDVAHVISAVSVLIKSFLFSHCCGWLGQFVSCCIGAFPSFFRCIQVAVENGFGLTSGMVFIFNEQILLRVRF